MPLTFKKGDLGVDYTVTLQNADGTAFDWSNAKYVGYFSAEPASTPGTPAFTLRDMTTYSQAASTAADGEFAAYWYDGRTAPSTLTAAVTVIDKTVNGVITVTAAAAGGDTDYQEIYMSATGTTTPLYRVATGADGFAAGGISIGSATYPADDTDLLTYVVAHTNDRSTTGGNATLGTPTLPTAVLGAGAVSCDNGTHVFALVNRRESDTDTAQILNVEIVIVDRTTGNGITWPSNGFDTVTITDDLS